LSKIGHLPIIDATPTEISKINATCNEKEHRSILKASYVFIMSADVFDQSFLPKFKKCDERKKTIIIV
jgi:hypothetical protein